jgi:hypothetical protein
MQKGGCRVKRFLKEEKGSSQVVSLMIILPVVLSIVITFLFMFPIFTTQLTLNAQAKSIAHVAEVTGRVGDEVEAEIDRLQTASGITVDSITWDTAWLNSTDQTMQLRTPFTVMLTKQVEIPIINPGLTGSEPVTVTLHASAGGISEVYYRP